MDAVLTLDRMAKKKPSGGKNKTPRTPVQMPDDWLGIARLRARSGQKPTLWYLIALIQQDAAQAGITDLPAPPWERNNREADS